MCYCVYVCVVNVRIAVATCSNYYPYIDYTHIYTHAHIYTIKEYPNRHDLLAQL